MRIFLFISLLIASLTAFAASKTTEVFTLDHQMSQNCEKKIKENLRFEKGISKIDVSLKENTITITFNPEKINTDGIIAAFKKIGFNAFVFNPKSCPEENASDDCCAPTAEKGCCSPAPSGCCGNSGE